jgi:ABC-type lipoprotein export system ATPase subunit
MTTFNTAYERGSEWRQWDLHIHSPASFHWSGQKFSSESNSPQNSSLLDEMIYALNNANPTVFALMDYWTFDGWFKLKQRLKEANAPKLTKLIFPGIELRLMSPMKKRLNAHVIFSESVENQILLDFMSQLKIELIDRPLSENALVYLARHVDSDKLEYHGFKKDDVDKYDDKALLAGSSIAEINCESYKNAIANVPKDTAVGFMPFDTSDGLAEINWKEHYAYCLGLFKSSPIFETRDNDTWGAFVGQLTEGNSKWFKNFQDALNNAPRLAVSGSDAHQFIGVKDDNSRRGYGDFPSGKVTWIKADPTFKGLLQAIKEPRKRSYIGEKPPKLIEIEENKTFFIEAVSINKCSNSTIEESWLDGCNLPLNQDLVAIIGNKGSGKSALSDIIALLGNSKQKAHFSFLKKDRFRGKSGEPAKNFEGTLIWCDSSSLSRNLNEDPPDNSVELVRYIPQGYFENLCNEHVSRSSDAFEKELRGVIFSHAPESIRLGALDFDQLIDRQESHFRDRLTEFRKDLRRLNQEISIIEDQLQPIIKKTLLEQLSVKEKQIEEHKKIEPSKLPKPSEELTPEQKDITTELEKIIDRLKSIDQEEIIKLNSESLFAKKIKAIQNVRERIALLERSYKQFIEDTSDDLNLLELNHTDLVSMSIDSNSLNKLGEEIPHERKSNNEAIEKLAEEKKNLQTRQLSLNAKLKGPQLLYQQNQKDIKKWEDKLNELIGTNDSPDTLKGIQARLSQLDTLPLTRIAKIDQRFELSGEILNILNEQRLAREDLFKPVQDLIKENSLIREAYKLRFQATLGGSADTIAAELFSIVKQNIGDFRGEDESYNTIRRIVDKYDFNIREHVLNFVTELHDKLVEASCASDKNTVGIINILRKDKKANDVYDMLFGLTFLGPRYSLLFQDTQIEQLSPGQRGALLLIFYLLVDKGRNPIVLDQPEENLDNETVVSLLAPVLSEAKKKRQIIMVTHNPNLAVYCDAEQLIYSCFNRNDLSKITYCSGSIENPIINSHVVNILEGTMPAFNNRKIKYY